MALALIGACALSPSPAVSQVPPAEAPACALAAQVIRDGGSVIDASRALADLVACPHSGPPAFALLWDRNPGDTALLGNLRAATSYLRDMRTLSAVTRVAENAALPRHTRLAAIRTLVRLYNPILEVVFRTRPEEGPNGPVFVMVGSWTEVLGRDGSSPITQAGRDRIAASVQSMAKGDPDMEMRRIAARLERELVTAPKP
jgi:hypothetical protein